jgi:hypothetical protein
MAFMPHSAPPRQSVVMRQILIPLLIAVLATIAALLVAVPPRAHAWSDDGAAPSSIAGALPSVASARLPAIASSLRSMAGTSAATG